MKALLLGALAALTPWNVALACVDLDRETLGVYLINNCPETLMIKFWGPHEGLIGPLRPGGRASTSIARDSQVRIRTCPYHAWKANTCRL